MFADTPSLHFHDPLAELLGAGDGHFHYTFDDAVKLAGHACPTVAGGFLLVLAAVQHLYGAGEIPQRGGLRVTIYGAMDAAANGPLSQIITLLTGAAADNGFHGLAGLHGRHGLMRFVPDNAPGPLQVRFERVDNRRAVQLYYDAGAIPPASLMSTDLQHVLQGTADATVTERFRNAWRERVEKLLADAGRNTIFMVAEDG